MTGAHSFYRRERSSEVKRYFTQKFRVAKLLREIVIFKRATTRDCPYKNTNT